MNGMGTWVKDPTPQLMVMVAVSVVAFLIVSGMLFWIAHKAKMESSDQFLLAIVTILGLGFFYWQYWHDHVNLLIKFFKLKGW